MKSCIDLEKKINSELTTKIKKTEIRHDQLYINIESEDLLSENYSFGAGIDYGSYYFDFAYVLSQANDTYQMYNSQFVNSTELAYTNHYAVITLGLRY